MLCVEPVSARMPLMTASSADLLTLLIFGNQGRPLSTIPRKKSKTNNENLSTKCSSPPKKKRTHGYSFGRTRTCKPVMSVSNMLCVVPLSIRLSLRKVLVFPSTLRMVSSANPSVVEYSTTNDVTCSTRQGMSQNLCHHFNSSTLSNALFCSYMDLTALANVKAASGFKLQNAGKQAGPGSVRLNTHGE